MSAATHIIDRETHVTGAIRGAGRLEVRGVVRGTIELDGDLEIAEGATVEGDVAASAVRVLGSLLGDVKAGRLDLDPTARFVGAAEVGAITVAAGAQVRGRVEMDESARPAPAQPTPAAAPAYRPPVSPSPTPVAAPVPAQSTAQAPPPQPAEAPPTQVEAPPTPAAATAPRPETTHASPQLSLGEEDAAPEPDDGDEHERVTVVVRSSSAPDAEDDSDASDDGESTDDTSASKPSDARRSSRRGKRT